MPNLLSHSKISGLFRTRQRFFRSTHLERDFDDVRALEDYVVGSQIVEPFQRLVAGLQPTSGQRAWRLTGDYGVGKSSFALLLAQVLSPDRDVVFRRLGVGAKPLRRAATGAAQLLPILVTGSRRSITSALTEAIKLAMRKLSPQLPTNLVEQLQALSDSPEKNSVDADMVRLLGELAHSVRAAGHAEGLLIILDEMGKFLEYAAHHPERQDVYFLQLLAEACTRSGDVPMVVVGLLHQGFHTYADKLSETGQREWEKVAGRFEQITLDRSVDQTAVLIGNALNLEPEGLPDGVIGQSEAAMGEAVTLGWYGPASSGREAELISVASRLYPLHGTTLPPLAKFLSRFGQHERSLFGFLFSHEPFGLQAFADQPAAAGRFYRLHNLYDFARANFGHQLSLQSHRSHWNHLESLVTSYVTENIVEIWVLKTVAMLNLVEDQGLLASEPVICLAVEGEDATREQVQTALAYLHKRGVLHYRGAAGGYCLWPHTSINLEKVYQEAIRGVGTITRVAPEIANELDVRPLVARRHYIKTGNLRHFAVNCVTVDDLERALGRVDAVVDSVDGTILLALCETGEDRQRALAFARSSDLGERTNVLFAVPMPLETLKSAVEELQRWRWVANLPELLHDTYAANVVSRQVNSCLRLLREQIASMIGLRRADTPAELEWFWRGTEIGVLSGRELLEQLSAVCDTLYYKAPQVRNELINRRELSSAAAAARMRLIERVLTTQDLPDLGMNTAKKPPERSMYLSVMVEGQMHLLREGRFAVVVPTDQSDPLSLAPTFKRMLEVIGNQPNERVKVSEVFAALRRHPYGVRDGLLPLLLSVLAAAYGSEFAFYEDGRFLRQIGGAEFMRLAKVPASFEVQRCRMDGVRASLFEELSEVLKLPHSSNGPNTGLLRVVEPLCTFAARLPSYSRRTKALAKQASDVRVALAEAYDPAKLLFEQLPLACGYAPFDAGGKPDEQRVTSFVVTLRVALEDLGEIYGRLMERVRDRILVALAQPGVFETVRQNVARTAGELETGIHEPRLRGFCQRLSDLVLEERPWLESMCAFVSGKPPTQWADHDEAGFAGEFQRLTQQFRRLEAACFKKDSLTAKGATAVRVAVTLADGSDAERVVHVSKEDEEQVVKLEAKIRVLIARSQRIGLAAASRAILKELQTNGTNQVV